MSHAYDFYKPNFESQYPVVDGKLSINCYLKALERCYHGYMKKSLAKYSQPNQLISESTKHATHASSMDDFDYVVFHSPVCKLTQKSFARLVFLDFLRDKSEMIMSDTKYESLKEFRYKYVVNFNC